MKKILFITLMFTGFVSHAQSEKFMAAMSNTLQQMRTAQTDEELIGIAQKLERIGDAEKTEWLPYYYAAMIKARMSMEGKGGDKDAVADDAERIINKAEALSANNSEIFCIKSMIASAKMMVDPQARWMQYGQMAGKYLEQAKKANENNPRPYYLQAISLQFTPEQFGGGCKVAKPIAEKALKLYNTFQAASAIHPNWGKAETEKILTDCK